MAKRGTARAVRLTCPKCASPFTVVAFLSQGINADEYWKARSRRARLRYSRQSYGIGEIGDGTKNPLKASKAAARGKK